MFPYKETAIITQIEVYKWKKKDYSNLNVTRHFMRKNKNLSKGNSILLLSFQFFSFFLGLNTNRLCHLDKQLDQQRSTFIK